mmetsp:Transcript_33598/g.88235  ORF Transcript_33598/g.88235 Transcript_33598/m.88235 type:complete len:526 (+) Transcript_33598:84-1661(+)
MPHTAEGGLAAAEVAAATTVDEPEPESPPETPTEHDREGAPTVGPAERDATAIAGDAERADGRPLDCDGTEDSDGDGDGSGSSGATSWMARTFFAEPLRLVTNVAKAGIRKTGDAVRVMTGEEDFHLGSTIRCAASWVTGDKRPYPKLPTDGPDSHRKKVAFLKDVRLSALSYPGTSCRPVAGDISLTDRYFVFTPRAAAAVFPPGEHANISHAADDDGAAPASADADVDGGGTRHAPLDDATIDRDGDLLVAAAAAATTTVDGGDVEVIRLEDELGLPEPSPPAPPPSPTHGVPASPLLPREYKPKAGECSIESSLAALFREEKLAGEDCFACEACYAAGARGGDVVENLSATDDETGSECGYVMRDAKRHFAITKCPQILTIHLKRFEQHGMDLHKVSRHVSFEPVIDMSHFCDPSIPFVVGDDGREGVLYELYAVVQHHGRMQSGHYTAYIKDTTTPSKGPASARWFHISDDRYTECSLSQVLRAEAYQLFYERLEPPPAAGPATPATAAPPPVPESTTIRV